MSDLRVLRLDISTEQDFVAVRQRARQLSELLGFSSQDQVRVATAVSEVTRDGFSPGTGVTCDFHIVTHPASALVIHVRIPHQPSAPISQVSRQASDALVAAQRLMDSCTVRPPENGNFLVTLTKQLNPSVVLTAQQLAQISQQLAARPVPNTMAELKLQNRELLQALAELRARQEELTALTRELEDTNRGVVALYAEIEEKAEHLRRVDTMKTRFLSNTSHELRTPLSSIRALAKLLLDRVDGDLNEEQEKQVRFIEKASTDLFDLVSDLLDLAKIEAGKTEVFPSEFTVGELFSTLRGILRPLVISEAVELIFEDQHSEVTLLADEGKVSQILRNFISNALKFTEAGEVRVRTEYRAGSDSLRFRVSDTGIGIDPGDLPMIFEEFTQVEGPLQKGVKGTGLGLPLCRKLAVLLGGEISAESSPGTGSTFYLDLPRRYQANTTTDNNGKTSRERAVQPSGHHAGAAASFRTDNWS